MGQRILNTYFFPQKQPGDRNKDHGKYNGKDMFLLHKSHLLFTTNIFHLFFCTFFFISRVLLYFSTSRTLLLFLKNETHDALHKILTTTFTNFLIFSIKRHCKVNLKKTIYQTPRFLKICRSYMFCN